MTGPSAEAVDHRQLLEELDRLARQAAEAGSLEEALERLTRAVELAEALREAVVSGKGTTEVIRQEPGGTTREEAFDGA